MKYQLPKLHRSNFCYGKHKIFTAKMLLSKQWLLGINNSHIQSKLNSLVVKKWSTPTHMYDTSVTISSKNTNDCAVV